MTTAVDDALAAFAQEVGPAGAVAAEGGRTRWDVTGHLEAGTRTVRAPAGIVEHRPEEMTVRVRAGTTVADLDAELLLGGQRSALPARGGTVGGALAVGENHVDVGSRRAVRDALLEVRYVSAEGRLVTGGGPTVKNVSGFDLPRLFVGSLGTLGLIAEVVLRVHPVPATSRWLRRDGADPFTVFASLWRPACVLWDGTATWVHLEGHTVDVDDQTRHLPGRWDETDGAPPLPPHRWSARPGDLRRLPAHSAPVEGTEGHDPLPTAGPFVASIGVGLVHAATPPPPRDLPPPAAGIARRLKSAFDPTGRLAPGRAVTGVATERTP